MQKALVVVAAGLIVALVASAALIGAALAWAGVATVRIAEENGVHFTVPIPMAAVEAASMVAGVGLHLSDAPEMEAWTPFVEQAMTALDECPDAVIVEVEDGSDRVSVEKRGRSLVVRVADGEADVEVTVPTRSARRTIRRLAG